MMKIVAIKPALNGRFLCQLKNNENVIISRKYVNSPLEDVKGYCSVATLEDIEKQDYILTPGRYVEIEELEDDGEPFEEKMTRLTSELSDLFERSHELEDEIRDKLGAIGYVF